MFCLVCGSSEVVRSLCPGDPPYLTEKPVDLFESVVEREPCSRDASFLEQPEHLNRTDGVEVPVSGAESFRAEHRTHLVRTLSLNSE